ncbi:MAG: glycosyltransferase [Arenicellales bacterium]
MTQRTTTLPSPTCLAMVVGNHSAVLARCLESVRPHISSFVIYDAGSTDNTRSLASSMLAARQGRILQLDPDFSHDPVPSLYAKASESAEYVLFMHPDEVFQSIYRPAHALAHDVRIVEVDYGRCSFMQPRLVRSGLADLPAHPFRAVRRTGGDLSVSIADHLRLSKQSPRDSAVRFPGHDSWHQYLGRREPAGRTPEDCVELAIQCSRAGDLAGARRWLSAGLATCDDPETAWQLHYLLGLSLLDSGDKNGAMEELALAFELDPDRLEPLHQLVRIKTSEGDLQSAADLSRLALDLEIPLSRGYLERGVYERARYIQHIVILERLGEYAEAKDACDALLQVPDRSVDLRRFLEKSGKRYESLLKLTSNDVVPEPPARNPPLLTVGMAVADDYDGVYFTVMSILLFHRECLAHLEFLVVDNNPGSASAAATRRFCEKLGIRYMPVSDYRSTAVRDSVFRYAGGRFVLCMDCHVMLLPGALARLIEYIEADSASLNFLQGPLVNDRRDQLFTHLESRWKDGMYGVWGQTEGVTADSPPFEIPMQGLGVFCCRKEAWPGLNPRFCGFGGEEGYLHEKFRRSGGKVLCLPFLQWAHRFERPFGIPYRINWQDRIRNYLIGHDELDWDPGEMATHFARVVGFDAMSRAMSGFLRERESPFFDLDGIYFLDHNTDSAITTEMSTWFREFGISSRVRRIELGRHHRDEHFPAAVRRLLDSSITHGFGKVLVISSLELLPNDLGDVLANILGELESRTWSICFLGLESDPKTGLPMESGIPGVMRVHHDDDDSPEASMSLSGSFLINVESKADWIRALLRFSDDPEADSDPTGPPIAETAGEAHDTPACYAACPPVTVRRDRFATVDDPARYCSIPGEWGDS